MQTSYSKWWLVYFILLKIGKGERSQLTFIALLRRAGDHQVADLGTITGHSPGSHQTLFEDFIIPLLLKFLMLNIFENDMNFGFFPPSPQPLPPSVLCLSHAHGGELASWEKALAGPLIYYRTQCYKLDSYRHLLSQFYFGLIAGICGVSQTEAKEKNQESRRMNVLEEKK